mgnify:CR=1 FL=1
MTDSRFLTYTDIKSLPEQFKSPPHRQNVGTLLVSFDFLKKTFGDPIQLNIENSNGKSDVEWCIWFPDEGVAVSIYNWKNGPNYCGPDGTPVHEIIEWSVAGHGPEAVLCVDRALTASREVVLSNNS